MTHSFFLCDLVDGQHLALSRVAKTSLLAVSQSTIHLKLTHTSNKHICFVIISNHNFRITNQTPLFLSNHLWQSSSASSSVSDSLLRKSHSYMLQAHTSLILTCVQHTHVSFLHASSTPLSSHHLTLTQ